MKKIGASALLFLAAHSHAYDGLSSELSHAVGGALLAGAVTHIYRESENRAWIGFAVSTAAVVLEQSYEISRGANRNSQIKDMAWHALGAALGAWATDKYILMPVVTRSSVGMVMVRSF
jgi:VanZ family protein